MGVLPPEQKFNIPEKIQGLAEQSIFAGQAECTIRRTVLPITYLDFHAQFSAVSSLLDCREVLCAERLEFVDFTAGALQIVNSVELTERLSETAPMWARAVAPVAEWVAQALWSLHSKSSEQLLPTRLTQRRRAEGRGNTFTTPVLHDAPRPKICELCGAEGIKNRYCRLCGVEVSRENMTRAALIAHARPKTTRQRRQVSKRLSDHAVANSWWSPSSLLPWLNEEFYVQKIQPQLSTLKVREIAQAMQVSQPYAAFIRSGRRRPHPRHWQALARLARVQVEKL